MLERAFSYMVAPTQNPAMVSTGGRERGFAVAPPAVTHEPEHPNIHLKFFRELSAAQLAELTGGELRTINEVTGRAQITYPWDSGLRLDFNHPDPESSAGEPLSTLRVHDYNRGNEQQFRLNRTVVVTDDLKPGEVTFVWPTPAQFSGRLGDAEQWITIGRKSIAIGRMSTLSPDLAPEISWAAIRAGLGRNPGA